MPNIIMKCIECNSYVDTGVSLEEYTKHVKSGKHIQDSFPNLSIDIRELFISRICGACWKRIFKEFIEDDE